MSPSRRPSRPSRNTADENGKAARKLGIRGNEARKPDDRPKEVRKSDRRGSDAWMSDDGPEMIRNSNARREAAHKDEERRQETRQLEVREHDTYRPDYTVKHGPKPDNHGQDTRKPENRAKDTYRPDYNARQGSKHDNRAKDARSENKRVIKTEDERDQVGTAQEKPRLPSPVASLLSSSSPVEPVKNVRGRRPIASDFLDGASHCA
jgi:hypothetical protein